MRRGEADREGAGHARARRSSTEHVELHREGVDARGHVLERADWKAAAALPITPTEYPQADSLTHFTRGFGLAWLGDRAGARKEIDAMQRFRAAMAKSGDSYWADRTQEQILAVSAWVALSEGAADQADADAAGG